MIIKNPTTNKIVTNFRGREIVIKPKGSIETPDTPRGDALFHYLLETYQFLLDRTPRVEHSIGVVKKAQPKKKEVND